MSLTFDPTNRTNRLMTAAKQAGSVMLPDKQGLPSQNTAQLPSQAEDTVTFSGPEAVHQKTTTVQFGERLDGEKPSLSREMNLQINYKNSHYELDQSGFDPDKKYRFWDKSPETEVYKLLKNYKTLAKNMEQASMYPVDQKHPLIRMMVKLGRALPEAPDAHLRVAYSLLDGILGKVLTSPRNWEQTGKLVDHHLPALLQQAARQSEPMTYWEKLHRMVQDMAIDHKNPDLPAFSDFLLKSGHDSFYFREMINLAVQPEKPSSTRLINNWLMNPEVMDNLQGETLGVINTWPKELFTAFSGQQQDEFIQMVFMLATLPLDMSVMGLPMMDLSERISPQSFEKTREAMLDTMTSLYADYQETLPPQWVKRFRTFLSTVREENRSQWIGLMDKYRADQSILPARKPIINQFLIQGMKKNLPPSHDGVIASLADLPAPPAAWDKITRILLENLESGRPVTLPEVYTQYLDNSQQRDPIWEARMEQAIRQSDDAYLLGTAQLKKHFQGNIPGASPKRLALLQQHLSEQIRIGNRTTLPDVLNTNILGPLSQSFGFSLREMENFGVVNAYNLLLTLPVSDDAFKLILRKNNSQPLGRLLFEAASRPGVKVSDEWLQGLQESLAAAKSPEQPYVQMMLFTRNSDQAARKDDFTVTLNALFNQGCQLDAKTLPWLKEFLTLPVPDKDWKVFNESLQGAGTSLPQQLHRTLASVMANNAYEFDAATLGKFSTYLREMGDQRSELIDMKKLSLETQTSVSENRAKLFRKLMNREFALSYPEQKISGAGYQLISTMPVSDRDWTKLVLGAGQTDLLDVSATLINSFPKLDLADEATPRWLTLAAMSFRQQDDSKRADIFTAAMECTAGANEISDARKKTFLAYLNTQLRNPSTPLPGDHNALASLLKLPVTDAVWGRLLNSVKSGENLDRVLLSKLDKLDLTQPGAEQWLKEYTDGKKNTKNPQWPYLEVLRQTYEPASELNDARKQGLRELITNLVLGGQSDLSGDANLSGLLQGGLTKGLSENQQLNKLLLFANLPVDDGTWTALNNELKKGIAQGATMELEPILLKVATDDGTPENVQWLGLMEEYLKDDPGSVYLKLKKDVADADVPASRKASFNQLLNRLFEKRNFYTPDETLAKRFNLLLTMPVEESAWQELLHKLTSRTQEEVALGTMPNMVLQAVSSLKNSEEARTWLAEFESFTSKTEPTYRPFLQMRAALQEASSEIRGNRGALFTEILGEVIRNQYIPDGTTAERYKLLLEMPIADDGWQALVRDILKALREQQPVSSLDLLLQTLDSPSNSFGTPEGLQWLERMEKLLNRVDQPVQAGKVSLKRLLSSGTDLISTPRRTGLEALLDKTRNLPLSGERLQNLGLFAKLPVSDAYWSMLYENLSGRSAENIDAGLNELLTQVVVDPGVELTPEWTADYQQVLRQTGRQELISQLSLQQDVMKDLQGVSTERQATLRKLVGKALESGQGVGDTETRTVLNLLADWPAERAQWQNLCNGLMNDLEARRGTLSELVNTNITNNFFTLATPQLLTPQWLKKFSDYLQAQVNTSAGKDLQQTARLMAKALSENIFAQAPERKQPFFQLLGALYANDYKLENVLGDILLTYAQLPVPQKTWQATTRELIQKAQSNAALRVPELITRDLYGNLQQATIPVSWIKGLSSQLQAAKYDNQTVLKQLKALGSFAELGQALRPERLASLKALESRLPKDDDSMARNLAFVSLPVNDAAWNRLLEMTRQVEPDKGPVLMEEMMLTALSFDNLPQGWSDFAKTLIGQDRALEKRQEILEVKQALSTGDPKQLSKLLHNYRDSFFIRYYLELATELESTRKTSGYLLLKAALGDEKAFSIATRNATTDQLAPVIQERARNNQLAGQDKNQAELMALLSKRPTDSHRNEVLQALAAMSPNPDAMKALAKSNSDRLAAVLGKVGNIGINFQAMVQSAPFSRDAEILVRPGFLAVSAPSMGTLVIRNSREGSAERAAMPQAAYYSPVTLNKQELSDMDPANDARFESLLNADLYGQPMAFNKLAFLLNQIQTR